MIDSGPSHSDGEKATRKRSNIKEMSPKRPSRIKLYFWLGMILLCGVLIIEGTSRGCYEASYNSLETSINALNSDGRSVGIPLKDVEKHIRGYAFRRDKIIEDRTKPIRGEPVITRKRRIIYRWPSLLRRYEFRLAFGKDDDQVIAIEAVVPGFVE